MSDLNQLYAALAEADRRAEAGDEEARADAIELAQMIRDAEAQANADYAEPMIYGIAGGVAGGAKGTVDLLKDLKTPPPAQTPVPTASPAATGYTTPHGFHPGATSNAEFNLQQAQANPLKRAASETPGFYNPGNSRLILPTTLSEEALAAPKIETDESLWRRARQNVRKIPKKGLEATGKVLNQRTGVNVLSGGMAGYQGADAYNRLQQGDILGGTVSGVGALGSGAALTLGKRNPVIRAGGLGLSGAAALINKALDKDTEEKATGGVVGYAGGQSVKKGAQALKKLFDPRFDQRVLEQEKLANQVLKTEKTGVKDIPRVFLPDYEGHPIVTSMSDRTAGGSRLLGINDVNFNRPVELTGGQEYMYNNPGQVWASGKNPVNQIMRAAVEAKRATGKDPLYMPWRMAPTASDFAHMTGETMLTHAQSSMGRAQKKDLDNTIKKFIPDWSGIDDPQSMQQFMVAPAAVRKSVQNAIDRDLRGSGALGIGETRLAIADPDQLIAPEGGLMHVGRIHADRGVIEDSGNVTYPKGVPGEGLGRIEGDHMVTELLPQFAKERGIADVRKPSAQDLRALQMKPYTGIIDDKLLKALGYAEGGPIGYAAGKAVKKGFENTVKAYKLFRTDDKGNLYPLFVNANKPVPMGEWLKAEAGPLTEAGKVKSKIGELAYRPGWHSGEYPVATHIGGKSSSDLKAPDFRLPDQVWAEVEHPADVDWQKVAMERAQKNKKGEVISRTAHITDQIPFGGNYRYKTNPNMTGDWIISGDMKVNRVLPDEEVMRINEEAGVFDLPRFYPLDKKAEGGLMCLKEGGHASPAWQRKEGKNPEGGLNAAGRASYNRETGGNLKPPVSSEQAKKSPKSAARRKSFCARMSGMEGPMKDEKGRPTRKALALRKWDC